MGGQLLQGGNVVLEFPRHLSERAVFDAGLEVQVHDAVLMLENSSLSGEVQGRYTEVEAAQEHLQLPFPVRGKVCPDIQVDGKPHAAVFAGAEAGLGLGVQGEAVLVHGAAEAVKPQGQGI